MKTPKKNPIAAVVQPLQGKQMPADWKIETNDFGGTFDRRDLENMWRNPQWNSKFSAENVGNVVRGARLSTSASGV
jgi:hypothetical protein